MTGQEFQGGALIIVNAPGRAYSTTFRINGGMAPVQYLADKDTDKLITGGKGYCLPMGGQSGGDSGLFQGEFFDCCKCSPESFRRPESIGLITSLSGREGLLNDSCMPCQPSLNLRIGLDFILMRIDSVLFRPWKLQIVLDHA